MAANDQDPLEIFPLPVWECILEQLRKEVGSSRDVSNCSKVCTEFERILEPTKQEWLFESICPFIFPYVKGGELLACRKVCKNWRLGVDNFLQDFETWRPFDEGTSVISRSTNYDPLQQKKIKWTKIMDKARLKAFLEAMKKQEMKTPFVGRSLYFRHITGFRRKEERRYLDRILEMFSLYGDHIWHLRVVLPNDSCNFCKILKQLLGYTTNLKCLTIDSSCLLEAHPPPEIKSLETLEIYTSTPLVVSLEKLISKFNFGNLKCLKLHHDSSKLHEFLPPFACMTPLPYAVMTRLHHLTELHASGIRWYDLENIFNNVISPTAPLAKLILDFDGGMMIPSNFDDVCRLISKWKRTLRMLAIKGNMNSCNGNSLLKLDAPNLKSLEIEKLLSSTYFLKTSVKASLEYLQIRCFDLLVPTRTRGQAMECYKSVVDAGDLRNSSIWGEMKKLKIVRFQRPRRFDGRLEEMICTREMHERVFQAKTVGGL